MPELEPYLLRQVVGVAAAAVAVCIFSFVHALLFGSVHKSHTDEMHLLRCAHQQQNHLR